MKQLYFIYMYMHALFFGTSEIKKKTKASSIHTKYLFEKHRAWAVDLHRNYLHVKYGSC